ncbi:transglycosylase SLT domain-containing protein [Bosea sp. RAF48]|uniref:transglycosylase SLT domain-containing protein n=1 Tax=Bosea sp. RAF48 TaxID=3237480 RepID=UPI003F939C73
MSERFRQFQALFPEEACLAELMRLRHGGTIMACPACGRGTSFAMRPKLRGFACNHCHYMIHPAAGTPMESRRTPLQLWFFALKTLAEQPGKGAAAAIAREANVPHMTAQRLVDELSALGERSDAAWFASLRHSVGNAVGSSTSQPVRVQPSAPQAIAPLGKAGPVRAAGPAAKAQSSVSAPASAVGSPALGAKKAASPDGEPAQARAPRHGPSRGVAIAAVGGGIACIALAVLGLAYARLRPPDRPLQAATEDVASTDAPALKDGPARPSLILSSVEQDLEGARQAAQFALDNDPSLAAIRPQEDAPTQQVPVNQLQLPSNILLVPPKMQGAPTGSATSSGAPQPPPQISGGDPDQILTFGPIKIRRHLVDTIVRASKIVGADPTLLMAVADKESSFSTAVKAQTSSATGLYQFIEQTWLGVIYEFGAKHGLASEAKLIGRSGRQFIILDGGQRQRILDMRREPYISALLAAEMLKRDTLRLERAMGRHLTGGEIYLIHFLGPDAAQTFIETMEETPGVKAAELLPKPAQANRPIFYADAGGETKTLSVSEVHKKFNDMIKVRLDRYSAVRPTMGPGLARPQPKK